MDKDIHIREFLCSFFAFFNRSPYVFFKLIWHCHTHTQTKYIVPFQSYLFFCMWISISIWIWSSQYQSEYTNWNRRLFTRTFLLFPRKSLYSCLSIEYRILNQFYGYCTQTSIHTQTSKLYSIRLHFQCILIHFHARSTNRFEGIWIYSLTIWHCTKVLKQKFLAQIFGSPFQKAFPLDWRVT